MKPLAAIIRSSDRVAERVREGTFHGDEDQVADVARYCGDRHLTYELLPPELDVSGGKPIEQRPSLRAAIEGVEAGKYSGIVTANLKRLTRSRSGLQIWERVEAAGGHVHTAAEQIDTSTPNGRFMRDIFLADAVREREEHAERHAKRRAATVEAGMWRQHQLPRGYQFAGPAVDGKYRGKARRLVPGPDADQVRQAARDVIAGVSMVKIATGLRMTPSGARAMLRNRVYLGELRDGPNVNPAAHEAILDAATFDAVQHALKHNPRPARRADAGPALLAGLIRCSGCGHVMTRAMTTAPVYGCAVHHSGQACPAPAAVTLATIDAFVEAIALAEAERIHVTARDSTRTLELAEMALNEARAARKRIVRIIALAGEDESDADLAQALRDATAAVDAAAARLEGERGRSTITPAVRDARQAWPFLDATERNQFLRRLLAAVVVERSGGRGVIRPLTERVRVIAYGTQICVANRNGGEAAGIVPIPLPDADAPGVLRPLGGQDSL